MKKKLFYFGCSDQVGHYLFPSLSEDDKKEMPDANFKIIKNIDGLFTPENDTSQGAGTFTQIGPLSIIAWHDYTIDKRPKSNSAIVGYGYIIDCIPKTELINQLLADFHLKFPAVFRRQIEPIRIININ